MIRSNGKYSLKQSIVDTAAKVLILVGEREAGVMRKSASLLHSTLSGECFICCIWIEARRTEFGLSATVCWAAGRVICWQKLTRLIFGAGYALENTLLEGAVESWKCGGLVQSGGRTYY